MHELVTHNGKRDEEFIRKLDETINEVRAVRDAARATLEAHMSTAHPESGSEISPVRKQAADQQPAANGVAFWQVHSAHFGILIWPTLSH